MRISGYLMALFALLAGGIGGFLRRQELATVFDPISGLAQQGAGITALLALFSVFVLLLLFALSFSVPKHFASSFKEVFGNVFAAILLTLLAGAFLVVTGLDVLVLHYHGNLDPFSLVRLGAALLAGAALMCMAIFGTGGRNVALFSVFPVFWLCAWLVIGHIDRATDPVLLGYVYALFAKASLLLALYYIAGYAFSQGNPARLLFSSALGLYFTGVMAGEPFDLLRNGPLFLLAAMVLLYHLLLSTRLAQRTREEIPYMERDME